MKTSLTNAEKDDLLKFFLESVGKAIAGIEISKMTELQRNLIFIQTAPPLLEAIYMNAYRQGAIDKETELIQKFN